MKSFKQFNEAGYTDRFSHQSVENDNVGIFDVANPDSLQKVNAFVGAIANQEYMNPKAAMEQLQSKLTTIGLSFDMPEVVEGKASATISQHGGRFGKDLDGSDINDDGISHRKEGGLKVEFSCETLQNGTSKVYAKLV